MSPADPTTTPARSRRRALERFGAREDETMAMWIERLHQRSGGRERSCWFVPTPRRAGPHQRTSGSLGCGRSPRWARAHVARVEAERDEADRSYGEAIGDCEFGWSPAPVDEEDGGR